MITALPAMATAVDDSPSNRQPRRTTAQRSAGREGLKNGRILKPTAKNSPHQSFSMQAARFSVTQLGA